VYVEFARYIRAKVDVVVSLGRNLIGLLHSQRRLIMAEEMIADNTETAYVDHALSEDILKLLKWHGG